MTKPYASRLLFHNHTITQSPQFLHHDNSPLLAPPPHSGQRRKPRNYTPDSKNSHEPAIPYSTEHRLRNHGAGEGEDVAHEVVESDARCRTLGHELCEHCADEAEY
jgi:hypothetical protein